MRSPGYRSPTVYRVADREDLDFTYSLIDRIFRLSLGELADFSGAKYDGDFSLTLEQAQRRKHEYAAGRQDQIYRDLFANIADLLPAGGRLYLQTMVYGRNMIPLEEVSIDAPRDSDAWYLALVAHQFPGTFLPYGQEQVVECADPRFRLLESSSGRLAFTSGVSANSVCFERELMDHYRLVFEKRA